MNVSEPPFSALSSSQSTGSISLCSTSPSAPKNRAPSGVIATTSPSSISWTRRVSRRNAAIDEVRDDLGVRLRAERVPVGLERAAQLAVVLDDAVEDDRDLALVAAGQR